MTKINVGLRIPAVHPTDPAEIGAFVRHAEELGFESIWVGHHVFYHIDVPDPLHTLTWVAAQTSRVRLGTSVMLSAYLNPVLLAKAAATIDCLSGGRLTLGMSIGGTEAEYASIGVPMNQRVGRLLENVAIMRKLWQAEGDIDYAGRYYQLEAANIRPKPAQPGGVPIYFGAASDAMRRRLIRHADGWVGASQADPETFIARAVEIRGWAREAGRDPDALGFVKQHNISIDANPATAAERANQHWQQYYGPRFSLASATVGSLEECSAHLQKFVGSEIPELTLALEPASLDLRHLELVARASEGLRSQR